MIIDFHTHILSPELVKNRDRYVELDPHFASLYSNPKAKVVTTEELIKHMDTRGVRKSVVLNIPWVSHDLCCETNDYVLESISRFPDRLIGFCTIHPGAGDRAIYEIERVAKAGAKGLGEMKSDVQGYNLKDKQYMKPVAEAAVKYNLIFLTHSSEPAGHAYPGKGSITPDCLYEFIVNFPQLNIVCAHWGGGLPFYALMPEVATALKNVYFDTAASPFLYSNKIVRHVADIVGAEKILFGSDYPLLSQTRVMREITSTDLPQEKKSMILGDNAIKLLWKAESGI